MRQADVPALGCEKALQFPIAIREELGCKNGLLILHPFPGMVVIAGLFLEKGSKPEASILLQDHLRQPLRGVINALISYLPVTPQPRNNSGKVLLQLRD